ncbi:MAG: hypothetical protein RIQ50_747 [Bacteroidota bacterium]
MQKEHLGAEFSVYDDLSELNDSDKSLLLDAQRAATTAYAPYSHFRVGAAAHLSDGRRVTGSNQENASYPVGICAERVLLSTLSSIAPNAIIATMAISYESDEVASNQPIAPCGMCRQSMVEYETRVKVPMRLILSGLSGKIYVFDSCSDLLPLAFHHYHLGK